MHSSLHPNCYHQITYAKFNLKIRFNYIRHEEIICNDRDPRWINKDIKQLILDKNRAYKSYIRVMINLCSSLINFSFFKQS